MKSAVASLVIACLMLTLARGPLALMPTTYAASSFRPTIFVNTEAFLAIDDDDTTADVVLRFGDTLAKTISFNRSLDRFDINDDVYVTGTIQASNTVSGAVVYGAKSVRSSGSIVWEGAASGAMLYLGGKLEGAGLTDCDAGTSKLLWDATSGRFSCGTDQSGGGAWSNTGSLQTYFDNRYVNTSGDTMTGTLTIQPTASQRTALKLVGSGSYTIMGASGGSIIHTARGNNVIVGSLNDPTNLGGISRVVVRGRYAYVTNFFDDSVRVIDVSSPDAPTVVGGIKDASLLDGVRAIAVHGQFAYVAAITDKSLRVIDISNPASPVIVGGFKDTSIFNSVQNMVLAGRYLYITDFSNDSLNIVDIGNPTNPILMGRLVDSSNLNGAYDVAVVGRYAYVAAKDNNSITTIDVSNPQAPFIIGVAKDDLNLFGVQSIAVQGRYGYAAVSSNNSVQVLDLKDPTTLSLLGSLQSSSDLTSVNRIAIAGRYLYTTVGNGTAMRVIDISNPTSLVMVGGVKDATYLPSPADIAVNGQLAYVVSGSLGGANRLTTINLNGFTTPTASIGALDVGVLDVLGDARFNKNVMMDRGLNVGDGLYVFGQTAMRAFSGSALYLSTKDKSGKPALTVSGSVAIGTGSTKGALLHVTGTISGMTLYATKSFSGAGLTDCDTAGTSKLLWDATTGRFSCGTDQTGGGGGAWSNTGSLQTYFDNRYVNTSGDTMTGVLALQNGTVHSATLTALLNVRGTMSGRLLNISGSGASALLSTTSEKPTVRIGGSGSLVIEARSTDPGSSPANTTSLFAQKVGGRTMLHQGSGSTFASSPLQNSLFGNLIMILTPGGGTTINGQGTTVTNDTTVSHPAAGETFGYMANFATAASNGDEAGTSSANTAFFRGSTAGANGFFYAARIGVVDTTSITVYSGMADQTIATMVGADNPTGNHIGYQFSSGRGDTNWQFVTKDGSTQNVVNTGMAFTANKVYDLFFTCTKQCASVTWEIRNVTDGTSAQGTTSSNLPTASAALRIVLGVEAETGTAKNIRMQQIYVEADR